VGQVAGDEQDRPGCDVGEVAQFAEVDVRGIAGDGEPADRARVVTAVGDVVLEELGGDRVEALGGD
jgi:hypothetical protein